MIADHVGNSRLLFTEQAGAAEIIGEWAYYPFGLEHQKNDTLPYRFNGLERNSDFNLDVDLALYRSFDPAIARWWQIDPVLKYHESPFAGFGNNPIVLSDFLGADTDTTYTLPTVIVTAKGEGSNYDQSSTRYGFSGTFAQWQQQYGFEGWSYDNASNYWTQAYSSSFDSYVQQRDSLEEDRIALEKLWFFTGGFSAIGQVYAFGRFPFAPKLPAVRSFSFTAPAVSSSNKWLTLSSLKDVQGVSGLYRFSHASRGNLPYIGQSNNIGVRLSQHYSKGNIGGNILYRPMSGSTKLTREIQETLIIQRLGNGSLRGLANQRFPVGKARSSRLGLGLYD